MGSWLAHAAHEMCSYPRSQRVTQLPPAGQSPSPCWLPLDMVHIPEITQCIAVSNTLAALQQRVAVQRSAWMPRYPAGGVRRGIAAHRGTSMHWRQRIAGITDNACSCYLKEDMIEGRV